MTVSGRARGRPVANDPAIPATEVLLDRALDLFAERGFDGMSVRELARELGVSHNLIPQRIGTKEQLWFAAVDRGFGALAVALAEQIADADEHLDDAARLRRLLVTFVAANAQRPALLRIISQEAVAPGPRLDHIFTNYIEPVRQFGDELLTRLEAEGKVRTRNVGILYFLLTHGAGGPFALPALAERLGAVPDASDPAALQAHAEEVGGLLFDGLFVAPA